MQIAGLVERHGSASATARKAKFASLARRDRRNIPVFPF
jgi:hypothetical protein